MFDDNDLKREGALPVNPFDGTERVEPAATSWDEPIPFPYRVGPEFPVDALPDWLRKYVRAVADSTQTPVDLPAMLALAVCAAALAKKARIQLKDDYSEPLNIYAVIVQPPATRKSAVFSIMTYPLSAWERTEAKRIEPMRTAQLARREVVEETMKRRKRDAAKTSGVERDEALKEIDALQKELGEIQVPQPPRLIADDCTPERLVGLMECNGGRIAVLSPEGDLFEIIAGRYSKQGTPNMGVFLKGHTGDDLRVDRVGRLSEFIERPAVSLGLTVQPDVLHALREKRGFRGRGLLGRILYSLPPSNVGARKLDAPTVPGTDAAHYEAKVKNLLALTADIGTDGQNREHRLRLSPGAASAHREFDAWVEPQLLPDGPLGGITDWAGKLVGAVGRIAGIFHLASMESPEVEVSQEAMQNAVRVGRYLLEHAQVAFAEMGIGSDLARAQTVLRWVVAKKNVRFSQRDVQRALPGAFERAEQLYEPLRILEERSYIRLEPAALRAGPGRKPSPTYVVNPAVLQGRVGSNAGHR